MAVKMDVANSIISAYAKGKAEATQAEELRKQQEQQQLENEQKQKQFEEEQKQFKERLANEKENQAATHAHEKAQLDLQHLIANAAFVKQAEDSGNAPQGFSPVSTEDYEISPGIIGQRVIAKDQSGNTITYRTPNTVNTQNLDLASRKQSLENEYEKDMLQYKSKLEENLNKLQGEDRFNHEKILQTQEQTFKDIQAEKQYQRDLNLQHERLSVELQKAGAKEPGTEIWSQDPIDPVAQQEYKVPSGTTWDDIFNNVKLKPAGQKLIKSSLDIEPQIEAARKELSTVTNNGQIGYDRYFLGAISGTLGNIKQKFPGLQDPYVSSVAPILGNLILKGKESANLGSALTPTEAKFLREYVPGSERTLTPTAAKEMLDHLITSIRMERINTIKAYGSVKGKVDTGSVNLTKEDTDANDLGGGFKIGQ